MQPGPNSLHRLETWLAKALDWVAVSRLRRVVLILTVAVIAGLPGLGALPVTDRDEARFAQATKQMLETGDLIDIRFQDQPRWKKPVGIYWLQAASASLAGGVEASIWAYRVPSLLGAVLAALAVAWAVRPLVGQRAAILSALMLPTALLTMAEATIAKTDAVLLAFAVLALGAVVRSLPDMPRPSRLVAAALWAALGFAVLVKGPIVPAIAALALLALWLLAPVKPQIARLFPMVGLAVLVIVVAPWLVAIWHVSDGRFFAESVGQDLLGKVAQGQEKHWGPPGLYLALVWLTLWPWAAFIPLAAGWIWRERGTLALIVLIAWVVPFWLVLEVVPTKLPHYVLPLYPALLTALACWAASERTAAPSPALAWTSAGLVAVPGTVLALALIGLPIALESRVVWAAVPLAMLGALAGILAAKAAFSGARLAQIAASLVAALALGGGILQVGLPSLGTGFASPRIAAMVEPWRACASGPLVSAGYREPSLVFLTETGTRLALPAETARILAEDEGALVVLERRWMERVSTHWETAPTLVERANLRYFNYNRGRFEDAVLLTSDDARWQPCAR